MVVRGTELFVDEYNAPASSTAGGQNQTQAPPAAAPGDDARPKLTVLPGSTAASLTRQRANYEIELLSLIDRGAAIDPEHFTVRRLALAGQVIIADGKVWLSEYGQATLDDDF